MVRSPGFYEQVEPLTDRSEQEIHIEDQTCDASLQLQQKLAISNDQFALNSFSNIGNSQISAIDVKVDQSVDCGVNILQQRTMSRLTNESK